MYKWKLKDILFMAISAAVFISENMDIELFELHPSVPRIARQPPSATARLNGKNPESSLRFDCAL